MFENVRFPFEDEEYYYKSIKTKGAFDDHYLEFENNANRYKQLSLAQYLNEMRPYFKKMVKYLTVSNNSWKIKVTWKLFFISSKIKGKEKGMSLKNENITVITGNNRNDFMKFIFNSPILEYQNNLIEKLEVMILLQLSVV